MEKFSLFENQLNSLKKVPRFSYSYLLISTFARQICDRNDKKAVDLFNKKYMSRKFISMKAEMIANRIFYSNDLFSFGSAIFLFFFSAGYIKRKNFKNVREIENLLMKSINTKWNVFDFFDCLFAEKDAYKSIISNIVLPNLRRPDLSLENQTRKKLLEFYSEDSIALIVKMIRLDDPDLELVNSTFKNDLISKVLFILWQLMLNKTIDYSILSTREKKMLTDRFGLKIEEIEFVWKIHFEKLDFNTYHQFIGRKATDKENKVIKEYLYLMTKNKSLVSPEDDYDFIEKSELLQSSPTMRQMYWNFGFIKTGNFKALKINLPFVNQFERLHNKASWSKIVIDLIKLKNHQILSNFKLIM